VNVHPSHADLTVPGDLDVAATSTGAWLAITGIVIGVLAVSSLRIVGEHQRVVVSRLGRVVGVRGPGLVARLPIVERLTPVSMRSADLPLLVSSTTRDAVQVRLLATGCCRVVDPERATVASADPHVAAADALERSLARQVARNSVAGLVEHRDVWVAQAAAEVAEMTQHLGVEIVALDVTEIETRLTAELLHGIHPNPAED
jgi:regulator of protease activity HflC (stomatin/prohibitin superfamily)